MTCTCGGDVYPFRLGILRENRMDCTNLFCCSRCGAAYCVACGNSLNRKHKSVIGAEYGECFDSRVLRFRVKGNCKDFLCSDCICECIECGETLPRTALELVDGYILLCSRCNCYCDSCQYRLNDRELFNVNEQNLCWTCLAASRRGFYQI